MSRYQPEHWSLKGVHLFNGN